MFEAFRRYREKNDITAYTTHMQAVGQVRGDFEMIASMIRQSLLPKSTFLEVYYELVILCWKALEPSIRVEREKRGSNRYLQEFENLAGDAEKYSRDVIRENNPEPIARVS